MAELVDISTNHLGAIEREVKTPTMETFVKLLNVLGAEPNEVLKEVIPLTRMEHTSVVKESWKGSHRRSRKACFGCWM